MLENPNSGNKRPFNKELDFNQRRWERQAQKHAEQGVVARLLDKSTDKSFFERLLQKEEDKKTWEDFMREEALRDDKDFKRKFVQESRKEYEAGEKPSKSVREFFLQRARDPERKLEQTNTVTALICMHGGMRAATIAGRVLALDEMGVNSDVIDYVIDVSSGAPVAKRFVGGREQILRGIAMFTGPLASKRFINTLRPGNSINLAYLKHLEDEGEYALDKEKFQKAHSKSWTVVTEPIVGNKPARARIIDNKAEGADVTANTVATMSIPAVTGKIPQIDGSTYYDGGFAALPIKEIVDKIRLENPGAKIKILIETQASFEALEDMKPNAKDIAKANVMRGVALGTIALEAATTLLPGAAGPVKFQGLGSVDAGNVVNQLAKGLVIKYNLRKTFENIKKESGGDVEIGVDWAEPTTLGLTSIDSDEMSMAVEQGYSDEYKKFGVKRPDEMPVYVSEKEKLARAIKDFQDAA